MASGGVGVSVKIDTLAVVGKRQFLEPNASIRFENAAELRALAGALQATHISLLRPAALCGLGGLSHRGKIF